ncbi:MAG TPA: phasin family protein [Alphaproteobacteria bacterium]|nr:phasin family protein [Alphaproteobacteria bacterium]
MKDDTAAAEKSKRTAGNGAGTGAGSGEGNGNGLDLWTRNGNQWLETVAQSNARLLSGTLELAEEVMAFSQRRVAADFETLKTLAACRNPSELAECQRAFAARASADYLDETRKLAARMAEVVARATASHAGTDAPKARAATQD